MNYLITCQLNHVCILIQSSAREALKSTSTCIEWKKSPETVQFQFSMLLHLAAKSELLTPISLETPFLTILSELLVKSPVLRKLVK